MPTNDRRGDDEKTRPSNEDEKVWVRQLTALSVRRLRALLGHVELRGRRAQGPRARARVER